MTLVSISKSPKTYSFREFLTIIHAGKVEFAEGNDLEREANGTELTLSMKGKRGEVTANKENWAQVKEVESNTYIHTEETVGAKSIYDKSQTSTLKCAVKRHMSLFFN